MDCTASPERYIYVARAVGFFNDDIRRKTWSVVLLLVTTFDRRSNLDHYLENMREKWRIFISESQHLKFTTFKLPMIHLMTYK